MLKKISRYCFSIVLSLILLGALAVPVWAIDVVVHPELVVANAESLGVREIRAIFAMKRQRWPNSKPITVVVLDGSSLLHRRFCKEILQVFPHQLQSGWDKMIYSGRGNGPVVVKSEKEMMDVLAKTPGSIGYVSTSTELKQLKVLEIRK